MKKFNHKYSAIELILIGLVVLGIILRIYKFGAIPAGLNRDEAALGYNAFAIANFGVDEWNRPYPVMFESFGDYKLPGYIYSLVPIILIGGVQEASIRLVSLLSGFVLILLAFLIVKEITKNTTLALMAAAFTATSPWAIFYSRTAFEAHYALMWLLIAILCLLKPFRRRYAVIFGAAYSLSVLTYNTPLLLAPVLIIFILSLPLHPLKIKFAYSLVTIIIALWIGLAIKPVIAQKGSITIFNDPTIQTLTRENYYQAKTMYEKILTHPKVHLVGELTKRYLASWNVPFLITRGGSHPWHSLPGKGHVGWTLYLSFFCGLLAILFWKIPKRRYWLSMLLLTGLALLPAVITVDAPHATRSLLFLWLLGIMAIVPIIKWPKLIGLMVVGIIIETTIFSYRYFVAYPSEYPNGFKGEMKVVLEAAEKNWMPNKLVYLTNGEGSLADLMSEQIYIYALLYNRISPVEFNDTLQMAGKEISGLNRVRAWGHFMVLNDPEKVPEGEIVIRRGPEGQYYFEDL